MPSVISRHTGDRVFETQAGSHKILNDVVPTPEWGGKDRYPTPPDYFLASISSCIAAFVVQYCDRSGIDSTGLSVELSYEKAANPAHLTGLAVTVTLPNGVVGERMSALLRVAESCTVHETIARMGESLAIQIRDSASA
jgi:uncharacterized OsmC-like protein